VRIFVTKSIIALGLLLTGGTAQAMKRKSLNEQLLDAAMQGNAKRIKTLIGRRVSLNVRDNEGYTSLHIAVGFSGNENAVRVLLAAGADPDIRTIGADWDDQEVTSFDLIEDLQIENVFKAYEETTDILPEEVRHIIPGVLAIRRIAGKDVSTIIASKLIKLIVDEKLKKSDFPYFPGNKLRQIIEQNIVAAVKKQKYFKINSSFSRLEGFKNYNLFW